MTSQKNTTSAPFPDRTTTADLSGTVNEAHTYSNSTMPHKIAPYPGDVDKGVLTNELLAEHLVLEQCSMCHEAMTSPIILLPCKHSHDVLCLTKWYQA